MKRRGRRCLASVKKAIDVPGLAEPNAWFPAWRVCGPASCLGRMQKVSHAYTPGDLTRRRGALLNARRFVSKQKQQ
ncbi:hypothetical protein NDU88_010114 [Pleurodeles waltl]|uniref:Uncharacterized protein n=1 Tax=Pleurodeles waltl TaxID=8319 RepID=A0AAV7QTI4_PLEWA|nr:hypothetical protein NDU88_010114 [Pleurodeles waltl]